MIVQMLRTFKVKSHKLRERNPCSDFRTIHVPYTRGHRAKTACYNDGRDRQRMISPNPKPRKAIMPITSTKAGRISWPPVLDKARVIVAEYDTPVTLRQLFYRLVAAEELPNATSAYKSLSHQTAIARREGTFPDLIDTTRTIHRPASFDSPQEAQDWLRKIYRRDRTENQDTSVYLGVEKRTVVAQLRSWFGEEGLPILPLGGYASQTFKDVVRRDAVGRPAVLLYAGDFDPSGEDISRDFIERVGTFSEVVRVALTREHVEDFGLPPQPGKASDPRANGFIARHGELVQVELEALDPSELRRLYKEALKPFWDVSIFESSLEQEEADLELLPTGDDLDAGE